jgi:TonB family protein
LIPVLVELAKSNMLSNDYYFSLYDRAVRLAETHYGPDSLDFGRLAVNVSLKYLDEDRPHKAKDFIYRGLEALAARLDATDPELVNATVYAGLIDFKTGQIPASIERLEKILPKLEDPQNPLSSLEMIAQAYHSSDEMVLANQHLAAINKPPYPEPQTPIYFTNITFPKVRRTLREEAGVVTVKFDINEDGRPENSRVTLLIGIQDLADSTVAAMKKWRFKYEPVDGKINKYKDLEMSFTFPMPLVNDDVE